MEHRVAVLGIIVEDISSAPQLNDLLHAYAHRIVGRMGIPYHTRNINIISICMDAPQPEIAALSGKIGALPGVSVKAAYSANVYPALEDREA